MGAEEVLAGNWNYDGQCNPFQASYIDEVIKTLEAGEEVEEKVIILDEKGFDAATITQEDVDKFTESDNYREAQRGVRKVCTQAPRLF